MKLYNSPIAPNPRRVRMFLAEKGVEIPTQDVDILKGENLAPEFLALNPRGLLPTLQLDDGTCIDEAPAICAYFEAQHPNPPLLGSDPVERAQIQSWERHMELDGMSAIAEVFRNSAPPMADRSLPGRTGDAQIPALVERGKRGAQLFYERLEKRLAESEYVGGKRFSLADITALCVVDFGGFAKLGIPESHAHTQSWYAKVSARPSAKA